MGKTRINPAIASLVVASATLGMGDASASGFALVEQSVKQVGSAISGGAASAEDASTVFFNPAGMTRIKGDQMVAGAHYIVPSAKFSGTATVNPLLGGSSISGSNGGDASSGALVPSFYYVHELNNQFMLGLGVGAPFGLKTEYDSGWVGRYHAIKSDLQTLNINPSVAYKVNDKLSLGAGVNYMRASATLSNAVDYSAACLSNAALLGATGCAGYTTPGNTATDGTVNVEGDNWSYGYNLGLLYDLNQNTRVGVAYRSEVKQKLTGTADFTAPFATASTPVEAALAGALADTGATASVTLPATLSLSMASLVTPEWELMADVTWTGWSSFDELRIEFDSSLADSVQPENWRDTYKVSVGFNYYTNSQWVCRGGVAYDQTPIKNAQDRTPRIPGNDRKWLAIGASYQASPAMTVDFALAHLFVAKTDINATNASGYNLTGTYDSDVNIASVGLVWNF